MWRQELGDARILIVDDDEAVTRVLERMLRTAGYHKVTATTAPRHALALLAELAPDLLLLDLHMPEAGGMEIMEQIGQSSQGHGFLPVLMLTGDANPDTRRRALDLGASDLLMKPFDVDEVLVRIRNLLGMRRLHTTLAEQNQILEARVQERTRELERSQFETLERLAAAAEFRDDDTGRHTQRVGTLAALLGSALGLPGADAELLERAAPLHDLGKIGIPDSILLKPGPLTAGERDVMQTHTIIGSQILAGGCSPLIRLAEVIALSHHERWDGHGYPHGRRGEETPVAARIVAVADFFDALVSDRPYRQAWPAERVLAEIAEQAGRQFDPAVAGLCGEPRVREAFLPAARDAALRVPPPGLPRLWAEMRLRPTGGSVSGGGAA